MPTKRGGDHGGGPLVRRVELSEAAARYIKRRATILSTRYRKADADATATAILEALATGTAVVLPVGDDLCAAVQWLQEARAMCISEAAQRGIDQIIAAIRTARSQED